MNRTGTKAPSRSALTGVWNRGDTFDTIRAPGIAPSRANENASRAPAPCTDDPQEKNAKMTSSSNRSLSQPAEMFDDRMYGTPPSRDVALT